MTAACLWLSLGDSTMIFSFSILLYSILSINMSSPSLRLNGNIWNIKYQIKKHLWLKKTPLILN